MTALNDPDIQSQPKCGAATTTRKLIRGSSLLTIGRMIAIVLNFLVQVITVRCLMKADYGAFEYGISIASMGASIAVFGLGRAINRFAPMFHEQKEFGRMAGTIVLALGCVTGIGCGVVVLVLGGQAFIGSNLIHDPRSLSLLMILILLAPLRALDSIFEELFAALAKPKALFFRRHLAGPILKLMALLPLIFAGSNANVLAVSYVVGGVLGTSCSAVVLWSLLKNAGLLPYFRRNAIDVPAKQVLKFSFALLSADVLVIVRSSLVTLILEFCHGAVGVAAFRAVLPVARLNTFVADSFRSLFSPEISRMYARGDMTAIDRIYWRTTAWIAVATFPVYLTCMSLADFVTVTLFGSDYSDSAGILRLLATGFYISAVVGFNYEVLKAHGHIGRMFVTDMVTVLAAIALNLWLVPIWGPVGGAASTVAILLMRPIFNQITIFRLGLIQEIDRRCVRLFLLMLQVVVIAGLLPPLMGNHVSDQILVTLAGSLVVMIVGLPVLEVESAFPELLRLRPIRFLFPAKESRV